MAGSCVSNDNDNNNDNTNYNNNNNSVSRQSQSLVSTLTKLSQKLTRNNYKFIKIKRYIRVIV